MPRGTRYNYEDYHRVNEKGELDKLCTRHEEFYPEENPWIPCTSEYFYINKSNKKDGLSPECKRCSKQKSINYNTANKEYKNKRDLDKYYENREDFIENVKEYRKKNIVHLKQKEKEWRENNSDKVNKHSRFRRLHKKHNIKTSQWTSCKDYFKDENNEWACAYCGLPISKHSRIYAGEIQYTDFHKEHVNDEGSNELDNCIPSCLMCNSEKHTSKLDDWYNENNPKYSEVRYNKIISWINEDYKIYL